jgi:alanyl-tRNA synthetase
MLGSKEIRQSFIDFFRKRGHSFVHSSPVVPFDDPTLLFANAGMNQFKDIFLGKRKAEVSRAVNSQKCIRAGGKHNDLEEVGKDGYHHTFFEMLGNWSFGDYYKKEAITWAWELLTSVWGLPRESLYATVHHTDQEALGLWTSQTDIDPRHVSYHGDKDNFWEMGETGPCGPCSEIHIDRGARFCDKAQVPGHRCEVNGTCSRYIELWNLVFIQYNREQDASLTPLSSKYVDTGAGLERITQVLQDKHSNYETDLFLPIIDRIAELSGKTYSPEEGVSHRVIADHVRCLCFALADGGFPSNEGRGYVLRRILRRSARHGRLLGFAEPFMFHLVDTVTGIMGHHYPELAGKEAYIKMVIKAEEERFNQTLDTGLAHLGEICAKAVGDTISGRDAFLLYDTYGFPLDLTVILAEEKNLKVDLAGFSEQMQKQKERARSSSKFAYADDDSEWIEFSSSTPTRFLGYELYAANARIQRYRIAEDGRLQLQLDQTPFYAESGGQVGDTGRIHNQDFELAVEDVRKVGDGFAHICSLIRGIVSDREVRAEIDLERRRDIARNHTCTHLLHKALKAVLGEHVQQKGSLVAPDYFRFDFTHVRGLDPREANEIESIVNAAIQDNRPVQTEILPLAEARKQGAVALFGEKYADQVRMVTVKDFSKELCGGTHVQATGEIGLFKITSESSSAAGIRRIEAVTGRAALNWISTLQTELVAVAGKLKVPQNAVLTKIDAIQEQLYNLEGEIRRLNGQQSLARVDEMLKHAVFLDGFRLLATAVEASPEQLRSLGDAIRDKAQDLIAVLFAAHEEKVSILCVVGSGLLPRFHAGRIVSAVAGLLGGKGGGRPESAMAGGRDPLRIPQALQAVEGIVRNLG